MRQLRVGIIGCGRMGKERARCVTAAGALVAAVFDVDHARSTALANSHGAQSLNSLEQAFHVDLDALFFCTAPGARAPGELNCIESGLPFFVEKPVGTCADACREIALRLFEMPVVNGVGYMNRYRGSVGLAKDVLTAATVIGFAAHWVGKRYNVPWWELEEHAGGPHNEQATHLFDLVRFLIGEVHAVKSVFHGSSRAATALECTGGLPGTAFYSCDGSEKDIALRIFTTRGSVALSGWDFRLSENSVDGQLMESATEDVFLLETETFLEAVRSRNQAIVKTDWHDALRTQAVMDAVRRSNEQAGCQPVAQKEWSVAR